MWFYYRKISGGYKLVKKYFGNLFIFTLRYYELLLIVAYLLISGKPTLCLGDSVDDSLLN